MSNIIYETTKGVTSVDITDRFLGEGKVFVTGEISPEHCNEWVRQLLYLAWNDTIDEITLFVDSPGGSVTAGLSLYDTIRLVTEFKPVRTVCIGMCASMGAIIFLAGEERKMMTHGKLMIHDPAFGEGHDIGHKKPHEIQIELDDLNKCREVLGELISQRTGMKLKEVYKITEHDAYFTAEEAVQKHLATQIITSLQEI